MSRLEKHFLQVSALPNVTSGNTALLVVDLINSYVGPSAIADMNNFQKLDVESAIVTTAHLSEGLRPSGMHQVWIADHSIATDTKQLSAMRREDVLRHLHPDLTPCAEDAVLLKGTQTSFSNNSWIVGSGGSDKGLESHLRERGIENVIITGTAISQCVLQTGMSARTAGFKTYCVNQAVCGGFSEPRRRYEAIDNLVNAGITVIDADHVMSAFSIKSDALERRVESLKETYLPPRKPGFVDRIFASAGIWL